MAGQHWIPSKITGDNIREAPEVRAHNFKDAEQLYDDGRVVRKVMYITNVNEGFCFSFRKVTKKGSDCIG